MIKEHAGSSDCNASPASTIVVQNWFEELKAKGGRELTRSRKAGAWREGEGGERGGGQEGKERQKGVGQAMRIDINSDMGESFGAYTIGHDAGLMASITSANIAAGFHGGDPSVLRETIRLAKTHGVAVGAHPGYPDLVGFGRRA